MVFRADFPPVDNTFLAVSLPELKGKTKVIYHFVAFKKLFLTITNSTAKCNIVSEKTWKNHLDFPPWKNDLFFELQNIIKTSHCDVIIPKLEEATRNYPTTVSPSFNLSPSIY